MNKRVDIMSMKSYKGFSDKQIKGLIKVANKVIKKTEAKITKKTPPKIKIIRNFVSTWLKTNEAHNKKCIAAIKSKFGNEGWNMLAAHNKKLKPEHTAWMVVKTAVLNMNMQLLKNSIDGRIAKDLAKGKK